MRSTSTIQFPMYYNQKLFWNFGVFTKIRVIQDWTTEFWKFSRGYWENSNSMNYDQRDIESTKVNSSGIEPETFRYYELKCCHYLRYVSVDSVRISAIFGSI